MQYPYHPRIAQKWFRIDLNCDKKRTCEFDNIDNVWAIILAETPVARRRQQVYRDDAVLSYAMLKRIARRCRACPAVEKWNEKRSYRYTYAFMGFGSNTYLVDG